MINKEAKIMIQTAHRIELPPSTTVKMKMKKDKNKKAYPWYLRLIRFGFSTFGPFFPEYAGRQAFQLFSTPRSRARHSVSDLTMEQARVFEFMYKGKILKAYEWGSGEKTILLVHGWESRGTALRSFVPGLLEKGFRVVAFDAPAHGNSSGKRTNLVEFAGSIKAIINRVGGVYGIIAHSFGGASTVFALANLQQSITLKRLVLVASPSRMNTAMEHFLKLIRAPKQVENKFYELVKQKVDLPLEDIDVAKMHSKVSVDKLLIIHDKEDDVVPFSAAERISEMWSGATFIVTEGYGHFEMVKEKSVLERVSNFM